MKNKIVFIMVLALAFIGSYIDTTNAAKRSEEQMPVFTSNPADQTVKTGEKIQINATVIETPTLEISWYKENKRILDSDKYSVTFDKGKATLTILNAVSSDAGTYQIKAENKVGKAERTCTIKISNQ